jgi:hypothetical protein
MVCPRRLARRAGLAALVVYFWLIWQVTPGNLYIRAFATVRSHPPRWVGLVPNGIVLLAGVVLWRKSTSEKGGAGYALPLRSVGKYSWGLCHCLYGVGCLHCWRDF